MIRFIYFPNSGKSSWVGGSVQASVLESAIDDANVINLISIDPDGAGDTNTFIIKSGNDLGIFKLDESTGSLVVAESSMLVSHGVPHCLTVEVEDSGGLAIQVDVLITILDANEAPVLPFVVLEDKVLQSDELLEIADSL